MVAKGLRSLRIYKHPVAPLIYSIKLTKWENPKFDQIHWRHASTEIRY